MLKIGVQSMTMDMVAKGCGISKRTLYEKFSDKKSLIISALDRMDSSSRTELEAIVSSAPNSFAVLLGIYRSVRDDVQQASEVFLTDVKRLYPEVFNRHKSIETGQVQRLAALISRAQDEGLALNDIDPDIAAMVFFSCISSFHQNDEMLTRGYSKVKILDGVFLNFLRGIATEAGRAIIKEHVEQIRAQSNASA